MMKTIVIALANNNNKVTKYQGPEYPERQIPNLSGGIRWQHSPTSRAMAILQEGEYR